MLLLFWMAILTWVAVVGYMTPAVYSLYVRQGRWGDPARLYCMMVALVFIGFFARRVTHGETEFDLPLLGLVLASIGLGVFTMHLARTYGRGGRV